MLPCWANNEAKKQKESGIESPNMWRRVSLPIAPHTGGAIYYSLKSTSEYSPPGLITAVNIQPSNPTTDSISVYVPKKRLVC